ncbi:MAG: SPOR domain-containing protein [Chitinispirillales bacterium]|nr:SPOR domain-containing protein [Chitinispirillales bacterium]
MKKSLFALLLSAIAAQILLLSAGCTNKAARSGPSAAEPRPDAVDPRERYTVSDGQTFLDTLNRGREIALSANDLPVLEVVPAVSPAPERGGAASEPRFRIQILASSQVDMARREKVNAENVMKQQVFMASDQSLYKLYVGDFKTRAEAEAALPGVRKFGYKDAWVVGAKITQ